MNERSPWSVLLVAHGTIADVADISGFLSEIRHGRPAPSALIEEMAARYRAIGGSPLLGQTEAQASALEARLGLPVRVAMRFSAPRVEDVLRDSIASERVVLLPAAPLSVAVYEAAARRALTSLVRPPELVAVAPWALEQPLVDHWALAIRDGVSRASAPCQVILTAHSLPKVVIDRGDRYQIEFEAFARAVQAAAGVDAAIAYQSQGQSEGEWLGPDLARTIEQARASGQRSVLIAPLGFLCEHVETLFDLDIEARAQADRLGIEFVRLPAPGAAPGLIAAMETAVRRVIVAS